MSTVNVDSEAFVRAVSSSVKMRAVLQAEAEKIAQKAKQLAASEVGSVTGGYANSFKATTTTADSIYNAYRGYEKRRGRKGEFSPLIEGRFAEGAYRGVVGVAYAKYLPALFIEVGSYDRPGKYILTRAASDGNSVVGVAGATRRKPKFKASPTTRSQRYRNTRDARAFEKRVSAAGGRVPKQYVQRRLRKGGQITESDFKNLTKRKR